MVLFRVRGVPVKVGWSWLVISGLVCWSLAGGFFPAAEPDLSPLASWTLAVLATLLFFVSILLHELSHTLQSLRDGVPVRDVTLWLFGGVSRADDPIPGPGAELRIVAAGPLASAVLAAFFWGVTALGERTGVPSDWLLVPDCWRASTRCSWASISSPRCPSTAAGCCTRCCGGARRTAPRPRSRPRCPGGSSAWRWWRPGW